MQKVDCLMLAAGLSSRMGSWKMMLPFGGSTLLDTSIENALGFCHRVVLVTGFRGAELRARYQYDERIFLVDNPNYRDGMFSSIQAGAHHVEGEHTFMALGDMPCISSWIYSALWQERGEFTLIPRCFQGKGHPILLPASLISKVKSSSPQFSMKNIIQNEDHRFLELNEQAIHWDIDTPDDYQRLARPVRIPQHS
ncbi:CTP--molybdopterin cytidylyltransferase [Rahnella woolbedingensis]|uniref:CTP--molybdopterin cytidylyltransferase n=1 Tax=Rahnella woolbedingensis TaxID=1510574 RepID=A0A419N646_9GAMM|nr:NTP transferase domain-containing protein [Rahnella woolbedingensis]RJT42237.1 CTP--molybdopterin cytidylyltransferase [Rahnella woolbedingensis]